MSLAPILALLLLQDPDPDSTRRELEDLRQRLERLEQQVPPKPDKGRESQTLFDEGFWMISRDDRIRLGGSAQVDARAFSDSDQGNSTFVVRRARLYGTGILEDRFAYMVMGRWDQQTPNLHFAWVEAQHLPWARFRVGLFKEPFSLEGLHSDQHWDFVERSLAVANLLQLEDIGAMLYGKVGGELLEYGIGVFNGRGRSLDNNNGKEAAARLTLAPLSGGEGPFRALYLGASGSLGAMDETLSGTGFQTGAGTRFWSWGAGAVWEDERVRIGADVEWLWGPLAVRAEAIRADWGEVSLGSAAADFEASGGYVDASFVLTGEPKRRNRPVVPAKNFDPAAGTWGASEIALRWERFQLEDEALEAGLASGTDRVAGWTVAWNQYLNSHMALKADAQRLRFGDPLGAGRIRGETVFTLRWQIEF